MATTRTIHDDPVLSLVAFVATVVVSVILLSHQRAPKKKKDILMCILEKTAPVAATEELASEQGAWTCERLLDGRELVITKDPTVADYIFNGKAKHNYIRRPACDEGLNELGMFQSGLIWNNEISIWKTIRGCFRKALNDSSIKKAVSVVKREASVLLESVCHEEGTNLLQISRRLTFRATLSVFFGIDSTDFASMDVDEAAFIDAIVAYFKAWEFFLLRPKRRWDVQLKRTHSVAVEKLQTHVNTMLAALECREKARNKTPTGLFIDDLRAVCEQEKDCQKLLEQSSLEMLLAGTDTSSVTAYYALLGLSDDKALQQALRDELNASKDQGTKGGFPLLDSLIDETLRFKPVGPVVLREAVEADPNFPGGASINEGTGVLVHLAEMNLCSEVWNKPYTFNPRRFLEDSTAIDGKEKKFFPFGNGPKGCIGMHLGRREVNAIVETVVLNYDMDVVGTESLGSLKTHWDIANQPDNPVRINIQKIKPQAN